MLIGVYLFCKESIIENMENIIEVKDLTKKFKDFKAVNDISFSVKKGEVFAFLGPNGAGKTTTIKMLTTLLKPTKGEVLISGKDAVHDEKSVRHSFGIVFQDMSLDDELTAWENLEFHGALYGLKRKYRRERIDEMLKFVELEDRKKELVKNFSGGMKRRLEIARGLIHLPDILFLDEPTLGLDPQTRNHIWEYIGNLNKRNQLTVFLTTHYMEEAEKMADRIAIIDHGQIITLGTADEIKKETKTESLEEAFLKLTGREIRAEKADTSQFMKMHKR